MFKATAAVFSKASRRALTPKRGNKDFYKGTRQAYLPGGLRTGAPGKHVVKGKAKYRLVDEQVRFFVAPAIEDIVNSPLKPYVYSKVQLTRDQKHEVLGKFPQGGITGEHLLKVAPRYDANGVTLSVEKSES